MAGEFDDALMEIFAAETASFLSTLEELLIRKEQSGGDWAAETPEIFRIMHTIKSSSAMMGFTGISHLAHAIEDIFSYIRAEHAAPPDEAGLVDLLLQSVDYIKRGVSGETGEAPDALIAQAVSCLNSLRTQPAADAVPPAASEHAAPAAIPAPAVGMEAESAYGVTVFFKPDCPMLGLRALELLNRIRPLTAHMTALPEDVTEQEDMLRAEGLTLIVETSLSPAAMTEAVEKSFFVERVVVELPNTSLVSPQPPEPVPAAAAECAAPAPAVPAPAPASSARAPSGAFTNVEIRKLDKLVDLVSEMVTTNMVLDRSFAVKDSEGISRSRAKLTQLLAELQEVSLSTRMVTVRETFMKMNRIVRDMSRKQQKDIEFTANGIDTEVDRQMVETLSSPLMHIIRNAVDHGIEQAEDRMAAGKPARGQIVLSAAAEGRYVVIRVEDDGRGLRTEVIAAKALSQGIVTEAQLASMSEDDMQALIFLPGFSTSQVVTEYSGRGVGMDVVNESIRLMNGKITVRSKAGAGTRFTLKIPMTLALIEALLIRVGSMVCAVPANAVCEIVRIASPDQVRRVNEGEVVLIRDQCCRLVNLYRYLQLPDAPAYTDGVMIRVQNDLETYAVFVKEAIVQQDIVVKSAPSLLRSVRGVSGYTVLGNGRPGLILDTDELPQLSVVPEHGKGSLG